MVDQSYFEPESKSGSEWPRKIYRRLPMTMNAMESEYGLAECEAQCRLDLGPCHLFVYSWPECFLGDWNVDTEAVVKPVEAWEEKTVYGRQGIVTITF